MRLINIMDNEINKSTRVVLIEKYDKSDYGKIILYRLMLAQCIDDNNKYGIRKYKHMFKTRLKKILLTRFKQTI